MCILQSPFCTFLFYAHYSKGSRTIKGSFYLFSVEIAASFRARLQEKDRFGWMLCLHFYNDQHLTLCNFTESYLCCTLQCWNQNLPLLADVFSLPFVWTSVIRYWFKVIDTCYFMSWFFEAPCSYLCFKLHQCKWEAWKHPSNFRLRVKAPRAKKCTTNVKHTVNDHLSERRWSWLLGGL